MSKRPTGFKTQEDYNAYMRDYKAKRRVKVKEQEQKKEQISETLVNIRPTIEKFGKAFSQLQETDILMLINGELQIHRKDEDFKTVASKADIDELVKATEKVKQLSTEKKEASKNE